MFLSLVRLERVDFAQEIDFMCRFFYVVVYEDEVY